MPREPAWRVFASEYNSARHYIKASEPKKPSYVITPLGAKISRVFVVGVLTEVRVISDEVVKARVVDQTGAFYIFAGKYRPQVRQMLELTSVPKFVAFVGKPNIYRPDEDTMYVSVVPERIKIVDEILRDYWILDTAEKLKVRIEAMKEALNMADPTIHNLVSLGFSRRVAEGVIEAIRYYEKIDVERYIHMLKNALKHLLPEYRELGYELPTVEESVEGEEEPVDEESTVEIEDRILEILKKAAESGNDEDAIVAYEDILDMLPDVEQEEIDRAIDELLTRKEITEPNIGFFKLAKKE